MVWAALKIHIRKKIPKNLEELNIAVQEFVETLTPEMCAKYIDNLKKVFNYICC